MFNKNYAKQYRAASNTHYNSELRQDQGAINLWNRNRYEADISKMYPERDNLPQNVREAIRSQDNDTY